MLKKQKGITLIALVVTIVVLLILAGVTISLLLDENGIIAKSKDARTETRVSQIEDEVGMWKQHNFINKESNQAQESADTMLANLISRKLLTEEEIDRDQELITIKKKDGTIVKEISYSSVTINISKFTEIEGVVVLTVDSVEGMTMPNIDMSNGEEQLNNYISSLNEEQKKEIIRNAYIKYVNFRDSNANCKTFQDALDWLKNDNGIEEATETDFWNSVESDGGIDEAMKIIEVFYNNDTKMIEGYTVTNPDDKASNIYIAKVNGTYTFRIKDIVTGKTYTKKVEVNNIGTTADNMYKIVKESKLSPILLQSTDTNIATTFEKAYIRYNNEIIDITKKIQHSETYDSLYSGIIASCLNKLGKVDSEDDIINTVQVIIIIKDNKVYAEGINMGRWEQ